VKGLGYAQQAEAAITGSLLQINLLLRQWLTGNQILDIDIQRLFSRVEMEPGSKGLDTLVNFDVSGSGYSHEQMLAFRRRALNLVKEVAGVRAASATSLEPLSEDDSTRIFSVQDFTPQTQDDSIVHRTVIWPGYFETMGIPLLRGPEFDSRDEASGPRVAVVNETLAQFYFGNSDPLGKSVWLSSQPSGPPITIVGLVRDSKQKNLRDTPPRMLYLTSAQHGVGYMVLVIRTDGNTAAVAASLRRKLSEITPEISVREIKTAQMQLERGLMQERLLAMLSGIVGPLALLLTAIGLYGLLAYGVSQRTREIGVRIALGAQPGDVLSMVLKQGMKLTGIGIVIGIVSAFALMRLLRSLLFGVSPTDPLTFILIPLLLVAVALVACWLPARRASKVDPIITLRYD
jgi:predicted permease